MLIEPRPRSGRHAQPSPRPSRAKLKGPKGGDAMATPSNISLASDTKNPALELRKFSWEKKDEQPTTD